MVQNQVIKQRVVHDVNSQHEAKNNPSIFLNAAFCSTPSRNGYGRIHGIKSIAKKFTELLKEKNTFYFIGNHRLVSVGV
jgi:hypothetical protein